jgi:hypothetical protein
MGRSTVPLAGIVTKFLAPKTEVWQLLALSNGSKEALATLLAVLALDDAESVMHPQMMPSRPPAALLETDGQLRQGRGHFLAPWVLAEVSRLSRILLEQHAGYLASVSKALNQQPDREFVPVPPGFILADKVGSARIGPVPPTLAVDVSQSERVRFNLEWFQIVGQDYSRNRYLLDLTDDQLGRRVEDIAGNLYIIDDEGRISPDSSNPRFRYWSARLTEVQREMAHRHGPYPAGWRRGMVDLMNMPPSLKSSGLRACKLRPASPLPAQYLAKYGRRAHLELALREGRLRIAPASSYKDPSLNSAVRDDEVIADIAYDPYAPFNDAPPGTVLLPAGRVPARIELNTNFYAHCLSSSLSKRPLLDFEADACLIIRDPSAFLTRVEAVIQDRLPGWRSLAGHVEYYDPLQVNPREIQLPMSKHFRFAYQEEVRLASIPPAPVKELEPIFITVGSLEDVAELVVPTEV